MVDDPRTLPNPQAQNSVLATLRQRYWKTYATYIVLDVPVDLLVFTWVPVHWQVPPSRPTHRAGQCAVVGCGAHDWGDAGRAAGLGMWAGGERQGTPSGDHAGPASGVVRFGWVCWTTDFFWISNTPILGIQKHPFWRMVCSGVCVWGAAPEPQQ